MKSTRDRLVGSSLTGWKDAMDKLGYDKSRRRIIKYTGKCST